MEEINQGAADCRQGCPAGWEDIGGALYTAIGAGLLYASARKLKRDITPQAPRAAKQAKRTAEAVKEELGHA